MIINWSSLNSSSESTTCLLFARCSPPLCGVVGSFVGLGVRCCGPCPLGGGVGLLRFAGTFMASSSCLTGTSKTAVTVRPREGPGAEVGAGVPRAREVEAVLCDWCWCCWGGGDRFARLEEADCWREVCREGWPDATLASVATPVVTASSYAHF